ncbi:MAG: hypothetical protein Q7N50_04490 [Armatimonadota bacterium]|nr:hypothetical protein [Armatimonadota bacterium]
MAEERREEIHEEEVVVGAKGGAMAAPYPAGARPYLTVEEVEQGLYLKDRIRWGPVWAGLVIALTIQLVLVAIGIAVGVQGLTPATGEVSGTAAMTFGIWMAISALIALFLGGLAAARFAGIAGTLNGLWNGVVLWALTVTLGALAASLGASGLLGMFGRVMPPTTPMAGMTPAEIQQALNAASLGATWFVVGAILGLIAAAIGGAIGARREIVETTETQ